MKAKKVPYKQMTSVEAKLKQLFANAYTPLQ